MVPITQVPAVVREVVFEWRNTRAADLLFTHRTDAIIAAVILIGLSIAESSSTAATRALCATVSRAAPLTWGAQRTEYASWT